MGAANNDDFSEHLEKLQSIAVGTDIDSGILRTGSASIRLPGISSDCVSTFMRYFPNVTGKVVSLPWMRVLWLLRDSKIMTFQ